MKNGMPQGVFNLPNRQSTFGQQSVQHSKMQTTKRSSPVNSSKKEPPEASTADFLETIIEKINGFDESELKDVLRKMLYEIKHTPAGQRMPLLNDYVSILKKARASILVKVTDDDFFSYIQAPYIEILQQWCRTYDLNDEQALFLRTATKLLRSLFKHNRKIDFQPTWLFGSACLNTVAECINEMSKPDKFLFEKTGREAKQFVRLFDIYTYYQNILNDSDSADREALSILAQPILNIISSVHYIDSFDVLHASGKSKMPKKEKFLLRKCPAFLLAYNGSSMDRMLSDSIGKMMPKYILTLNKIIPSINNWKAPIFIALEQFLRLAERGSKNATVTSAHLPFIGHLVKMTNAPVMYQNIEESMSTPQSAMLAAITHSISNVIQEQIVVDYLKEKKAASGFIRLLSAEDETLRNQIYKIVAYIAVEEDIKSIPHIDIFVEKVLTAVQDAFQDGTINAAQAQIALNVFKNLVQHDQIKDEVVKKSGIPMLLNLTKGSAGPQMVQVLEIVWSMSFYPPAASIIRSDETFKKRIEDMSKVTDDEAIKKASQGLVWKLIQEPAFLEKMAKKSEAGNEEEEDGGETTTEVVIGEDGKETVVTKKKYNVTAPTEQLFKFDMMISYCHADKAIIYKIHQFLLEQGFNIWIDLNNMFGPAMSAMAEAVENSEFVLLCMSPSYKQSTYCQAEAEYAFGCKRRLIPLILVPNFKADGWLGFMIGSRIYIDFGFFDFDTACDKLMNEISLQRKRPLPSKTGQTAKTDKPPEPVEEPVSKTPQLPPPPPPATDIPDEYKNRQSKSDFKRKSIDSWSESDVLDFLHINRIMHTMPLCETMDGRALRQLYKMCKLQTNETYNLLNLELQSRVDVKLPIGIYTRFLSVMEQLIKEPPPPQPIISVPPPPAPVVYVVPPSKPPQPIIYMSPPPLPAPTAPSQPIIYMSSPPSLPAPTTPSQPIVYMSPPAPITPGESVPYMSSSLAPPTKSIVYMNPSKQYSTSSDSSYDMVITSNASTYQVLKMAADILPKTKSSGYLFQQNG